MDEATSGLATTRGKLCRLNRSARLICGTGSRINRARQIVRNPRCVPVDPSGQCDLISGKRSENLPPSRDCEGDESRISATGLAAFDC